jgi:hypothetical protein
VVFGVAWLIGGLGLVHLSTEAVLAVGLMLLGACLIVTARTDWSLSRHGWPVLLGVVLVLGLFATSASFGVGGAVSHLSFGNTGVTPTKGGTVYGGFGQLTVDTSHLAPGATLHVQSIAGETHIKLPANEFAVVQGKVLAGQICVNGHSDASGIGASLPPVTVPPANGGSRGQGDQITIDVHQLAGQVDIGTGGCNHR